MFTWTLIVFLSCDTSASFTASTKDMFLRTTKKFCFVKYAMVERTVFERAVFVFVLRDFQKLIDGDRIQSIWKKDATLTNYITPLLLMDTSLSDVFFSGLCCFLVCVICCSNALRNINNICNLEILARWCHIMLLLLLWLSK